MHCIPQWSFETKGLLSFTTECKNMSKENQGVKSKVETALSNAKKACIYWKNEDATKYGEWLVIQSVANRLLKEYRSSESNKNGS